MFVIHYPCSLPANFAQQSPPRRRICAKFGKAVHSVITCEKNVDRRGCEFCAGGGSNFAITHGQAPCPWGGCYLAVRDTRNAVLASAAAAAAAAAVVALVVALVVAVTAVAMYCRTVVCRTTEDVCTLSDRNIGAGSRSDLSNRDRSLSEDAW